MRTANITDICTDLRLQRVIVGPRIVSQRPDIGAMVRGGDPEQGMETEADPLTASPEQASHWLKIYDEMVAMEEAVLARIHELVADQSPEARREVELSNVPVIAACLARFKQRRGYWDRRIQELLQSHGSIRQNDPAAALVAYLRSDERQPGAQQGDSAPS